MWPLPRRSARSASTGGRLEAEGAAARAHAHDQAVAARHRPQRCRGTSPSRRSRRSSAGLGHRGGAARDRRRLRRVIHRPRARASCSRAAMAAAAAGFFCSMAAQHGVVGDQRGVRRIEQMAGHAARSRRRRRAHRPPGRSRRRRDGRGPACPTSQRGLVSRPRTTRAISSAMRRALGSGGLARVEMIELGLVAEQCRGGGKAAGEVGDAVAVQKVALAVVLRMDQHVGLGDAIAERPRSAAPLRRRHRRG